MSRRGWMVGAIAAGVVALGVGALVGTGRFGTPGVERLLGVVDEPGPRPDFGLPFACGQRWRLSTYSGHDPDDAKVDMFRTDGPTRGALVRASAAGEVVRLVDPGGVKIDHGGRWYTLSLHMDQITVGPGDELRKGQPIGRVGAVGTAAAHLHYEQLFDEDGSGWAPTSEIVHPIIQGTEYQLQPGDTWPVLTSTTGCGPGE